MEQNNFPQLDHTHKKHHKLLHMAMVSMCSAMMSVFFGFLYMYSTVMTDMSLKDVQVNALIDEVGDMKQEKVDLYQEVLDVQQDVSLLQGEDTNEVSFKVENPVVVEAKVGIPSEDISVADDESFNILILGTHGTLTDTIMVASINEELETVSLISIPRDMFVSGRKINEHYGLYGVEQLKEAVTEVTGLSIDKYAVIDLQAFIDIVDAIGGIDVYVDKAIYDNAYPNGKGGYMVFSLGAGQQHLDGSTALKYARSRHSTNDFDRANRQQKVIVAVKEKLAGMDFSDQAGDVLAIFESISENLDSDIGLFDGIGYYGNYKDYTLETGNVLTTSNYLYSTYNTYGQYILLPNDGNYEEVKEWVRGIVEK
ncbi:hypothetical protein A2344_05295 [Candidatus Peregrinibacteria bacterium RIFOXYB12_FULL_41_12]|nr:MAG: hypothetical protein A2244_00500 [Candidatus Peregrinibacteria bacterium RIFOXYA2_FULL_41_18]OGJ48389.1 MAG: hypothetical protein A2344_05295 [Candidatus Peregrinibacteria bacterium RIFOXYB12_FULL_41_12]OGJ52314.1 MAG: hypothetical protein A2336_01975 [Candidatus Peregrinibacteria bacterium RIFOXYB2_FULL_41_88]